jgi:hypothetical protein
MWIIKSFAVTVGIVEDQCHTFDFNVEINIVPNSEKR